MDFVRLVLRAQSKDMDPIIGYTIFTTTDCNARCFYCFELGRSRIPMSEETAHKTARYIRDHCGGEKVKIKLKDILTPVFITTVTGLVVLLLRFPVPALIMRFVDSTSVATLPMSMIVIGATMGSGKLLETFSDKRVYLVCLVRLIISPLLVWLVLSPICADPLLLKTAVVIAGCPCGVVVSVLSLQYDHDTLFASRSVMASTLLSVITLPIIIMLLG